MCTVPKTLNAKTAFKLGILNPQAGSKVIQHVSFQSSAIKWAITIINNIMINKAANNQ